MVIFSINLFLSITFLKFFGFFSLGASYLIAFTIGTFVGYKLLISKLNEIIKIEYLRQKLNLKKGYFVNYNQIKRKMEELK